MSFTLYKIKRDLRDLLEEKADAEVAGDDAEVSAINDEIDRMLDALENKHEAYGKVIKSCKASAASLEKEAKHLMARAQAQKNTAERLTDVLKNIMEHEDVTQLDAGFFSIKLQQNSKPTITVNCPVEALDEELQRIIREPNKTAIYEKYRQGETPDGVSVKYGYHVRIR